MSSLRQVALHSLCRRSQHNVASRKACDTLRCTIILATSRIFSMIFMMVFLFQMWDTAHGLDVFLSMYFSGKQRDDVPKWPGRSSGSKPAALRATLAARS